MKQLNPRCFQDKGRVHIEKQFSQRAGGKWRVYSWREIEEDGVKRSYWHFEQEFADKATAMDYADGVGR